jgi:hypothetical protein
VGGRFGTLPTSASRCSICDWPIRSLPLTVARTILESTIICPDCGHAALETMPTDACQFFYDCNGCGTRLKPRQGDCCVYCSYGSMPCPPVQEAGRACC